MFMFFKLLPKCKINIPNFPSEEKSEGVQEQWKLENEMRIGTEVTQDQDSVDIYLSQKELSVILSTGF